MSSMSSVSSSTPSSRRPVARRACLSCREKKIKCDGEPPAAKDQNSSHGSVDGGSSTNGATAAPNVCSNCKFLGIECVFVRSMRGGRRKKRLSNFDEESDSSRSRTKSYKTTLSLPGSAITHTTNTTSNNNDDDSKSNHLSLGGSIGDRGDGEKIPSLPDPQSDRSDPLGYASDPRNKRPLSPTLSYASTGYPLDPNKYNQRAGSSSQDHAETPDYYDYARHYGGPPHPFMGGGGFRKYYRRLYGYGGPHHFHHKFRHGPPPLMPGYPPPPPPFGNYPYPPPHLGGYGGPGGPHFPPRDGRGPPLLPPLDRKDKAYPEYPIDYYQDPRQHAQVQEQQSQQSQQQQPQQPVSSQQFSQANQIVQANPAHVGGPPHSQPNAFQQIIQPSIPPNNNVPSHASQSVHSVASQGSPPQSLVGSLAHSQQASTIMPQTPLSSAHPLAVPASPHSSSKLSDNESRRRAARHNANRRRESRSTIDNKQTPDAANDNKSLSSGSEGRHEYYEDNEVASRSAYPPPSYHYNTYNKDYYRNSVLSQKPKPVAMASPAGSHVATQEVAVSANLKAQELQSVDSITNTATSIPCFELYASDKVLHKFDLPNKSDLSHLLDIYYHYNQPCHQILPKRSILLKYFPIETSAAIYHAIISTVSKYNTRVAKDENVWIDNVFKHWDDLNTLQSLLALIMISKTSKYSDNLVPGMEITSKIWILIKNNKLVESCKQISNDEYEELFKISTTRQLYERELLVRLLWDFYIFRVLIFRLKLGYPYYKLNTLESGHLKRLYSEIETNYYADFMELPIDNETYFKDIRTYDVKSRLEWPDIRIELSKSNECQSEYADGLAKNGANGSKFADSWLFVLTSYYLESAADTVSRNGLLKTNLVKLESSIEKLERLIVKSKLFHLSKNKMYINMTNLTSCLILKGTKMVTNQLFVEETIVFKPLQKSDSKLDNMSDEEDSKSSNGSFKKDPEFLPLINEIKSSVLPDLQELPKAISSLSVFQWKCFIASINSALDIIKLLELGEGLVPENFTYTQNPSNENQKTYKVCIGVTGSGDDSSKRWWEEQPVNKPFVTKYPDQPDEWSQYPEVSLMTMGALVGSLGSFIIISKYVKFELSEEVAESGNKVFVNAILDLPHTEEVKKIEKLQVNDHNISQQLVQEYKTNYLLEKFATCTNYIKSRSRFNELVVQDLLENTERITHYLQEILTTQSERMV